MSESRTGLPSLPRNSVLAIRRKRSTLLDDDEVWRSRSFSPRLRSVPSIDSTVVLVWLSVFGFFFGQWMPGRDKGMPPGLGYVLGGYCPGGYCPGGYWPGWPAGYW